MAHNLKIAALKHKLRKAGAGQIRVEPDVFMLTNNQRKLICKEKRENQNIDKPIGHRRSKKERAVM